LEPELRHPEDMLPVIFISRECSNQISKDSQKNVIVILPVTLIPKGINPNTLRKNKEEYC
jgi:hypothetical protein